MRTWNGVRSLEMVVTMGSINRLFSCSIIFSTVSISNKGSLSIKTATCKFGLHVAAHVS